MNLTGFRIPPSAPPMPGFARQERLGPSEVEDLVQYVLALSRRETDQSAVVRAIPLYERHCAACHGEAGQGVEGSGAPDLTDDEWNHGGAPEEIRRRIWDGDIGEGPMRHTRLPSGDASGG